MSMSRCTFFTIVVVYTHRTRAHTHNCLCYFYSESTSLQDNSNSQATLTNWPTNPTSTPPTSSGSTTSRTKGSELFLHITPKPNESPAEALTRHYVLSQRDIEAIAHHVNEKSFLFSLERLWERRSLCVRFLFTYELPPRY